MTPEADKSAPTPARARKNRRHVLPDQPRSETEVLELANAVAWRGDSPTRRPRTSALTSVEIRPSTFNEAIPALDKWAAPIAAHWPSETGDDITTP